jgi:ferredoxin
MIAPRPAVREGQNFPSLEKRGQGRFAQLSTVSQYAKKSPFAKRGNNASFLARVVHFIVKRIGGEMKIIIDKDKCKGHNNCISIAPNVFEVDEKFKAFVLDPKGDSDEDILKAAKACPELAIILEDEVSGKQIFPGPDDKPRNQLGGSKWGG